MELFLFRRLHHQRIARVLESLDADLLAQHGCWFGGGTAIALAHDEYRESVDIDFLVSDAAGYRAVRGIVRETGLAGLARKNLETARPPTSDAYGIRTSLLVDGTAIKFEIIHEGRISLDRPGPDQTICGVRTLTSADQVASKLLANDDRWADSSVFHRDLIDLAMMRPHGPTLEAGFAKAVDAYGPTVRSSLNNVVAHLRERPQRLDESMRALGMEMPRAILWQEIRRVTDAVAGIPTAD